jgi:hypothetical protein
MDMRQLRELEQLATAAANLYTLALTRGGSSPAMLAELKRRSDAAAAEYRNAWREYQTQAAQKSAGPTGR